MAEDGDYIFYADESGDHSLITIDPSYPTFALSLCGFKKTEYCSRIVPNFLRFKFKYFGHDSVVLHEREIRKQTGQFAFWQILLFASISWTTSQRWSHDRDLLFLRRSSTRLH